MQSIKEATMTSDNPLLTPPKHPNGVPAFDVIEPEHFLPAVEALLDKARARIEALKNNEAAPDFENTITELEVCDEDLSTVTSIFYNQLGANGNDELQALVGPIGSMCSDFSSDIMFDAALFERVKAVYDQKGYLSLTKEEDTVLEDMYKMFVRNGALLDEEKKQRLREISRRMNELGPTFNDNVKKSAEQFTLHITDEDDLSGLPETALNTARDEAEERGLDGWVFTLDYPSFGPFLTYSDKRELREKIWKAFNNRAYRDDFDNESLVKEIAELRYERAQILGYDHHAHYVLEKRMAKNAETVDRFLNNLKKHYKNAADKDLKTLKAFAKESGLEDDLKPWDVGYYAEKLKQNLFDYSSEDLRPYFPLTKVLNGGFAHFEKLLGIRFKANDDYPKWHKDVQAFDVHDNENDRYLGTLYADFYPRKGKKPGAWKTSYRNQGLFHGEIQPPVVAIVCNFTKPSGGKSSLLTLGEVTTFLHEMGHAVHALLSDVTHPSVSGTSVKWDFVELPSQLMENWAYERETLDMLSGHHETGEPLPDDLLAKVRRARTFMAGWGGLRQVSLGILDMGWHSGAPETKQDIVDFEDALLADIRFFPRYAGPTSTSFSHLFAGGYAAGYYSYKWAEVLDADSFEAFLENGLYDKETAESLKKNILTRGGSENPNILYKRFRGREADPDALFRREGLIK